MEAFLLRTPETFKDLNGIYLSTILDPRFKKEAFRVMNNAEQAALYLESEMCNMKKSQGQECERQRMELQSKSDSQCNEDIVKENTSFFGFLEARLSNKIKSTTADIIITKRQYLERDNSSEDTDLLLFWKVTADEMHPLPECALKYLCIPATSVESERMFSTAGMVISNRRSRLKDENVEVLTFLNENKWLL